MTTKTNSPATGGTYILPPLAPDGYDPADPWYAGQFCATAFGLRPFAKRPWTPDPKNVLTPEQSAAKYAWAKRVIEESKDWPHYKEWRRVKRREAGLPVHYCKGRRGRQQAILKARGVPI